MRKYGPTNHFKSHFDNVWEKGPWLKLITNGISNNAQCTVIVNMYSECRSRIPILIKHWTSKEN